MAIAHSGTDTNNGHDTNVASSTHAHTNAGDFIAVLVAPADGTAATRTVDSVTFNGDACTHAPADADPGFYERTEIWYRMNPDVATGNVVVDMGGGVSCDAVDVYAASFSGVDTSALDAEVGRAISPQESPIADTITTVAPNCYVISVVQTVDTESTGIDASQTEIGNLNGGWTRASYSGPHASAGAVTHTYTVGSSSYAELSLISIKPAAAAVTGRTNNLRLLGVS